MEDNNSKLNEVTPDVAVAEFARIMDFIREKDPKTWVKLYCEAVRLGFQNNPKPTRPSFFSRCILRLRHLLIHLLGFRVFFRLYRILH